jgi:hypothetical protein
MKKLLLALVSVAILAGCQKQPQANFTTDKTEYKAGETIKCTNTSIDGTTYKWSWSGTKIKSGDAVGGSLDLSTEKDLESGDVTIKLQAFSKNGKKTSETSKTVKVVANNGKVSFWSDFGEDFNVDVTIDGVVKKITKNISSAPSGCDTDGCANFELKPGKYNYSAKDTDGYTWSGSVDILPTGCNRVQLKD